MTKSDKTDQRKVLISGVSGYLGNRLAEIAASQYKVIGIYNSNKPDTTAFKTVKADLIDDPTLLLDHIKPDVFIHCAAEIARFICRLAAF